MSVLNKILPSFLSALREKDNIPVSLAARSPGNRARLVQRLTLPQIYEVALDQQKYAGAIRAAEDPARPDREMLYAFYRQALFDGHLISQLSTRSKKMKGEPFSIVDEKGKPDEQALRLFQRPWFRQVQKHFMDTIFQGFSLIEFNDVQNGEFTGVTLIPRALVIPETQVIKIGTTEFPYLNTKEADFLMEIGDPFDLGLLKIATIYTIYKRYNYSDWAKRNEKYGMPMLFLMTHARDEKELDERTHALQNFGREFWASLPAGDEIKQLESGQAFAFQTYEKMLDRCDAEISKLINGQTLTSDTGNDGSGNRALGEVHERVLNEYTEDDMRDFQDFVNYSLIPFMKGHGYSLEGKSFLFNRFRMEDKKASPAEEVQGAPGKPKALAADNWQQTLNYMLGDGCNH